MSGILSGRPPGLSVVAPMLGDMETPLVLALLAGLVLGALVGIWAGARWGRASYSPAQVEALVETGDVAKGLERLRESVADLTRQGTAWQGQLHQQVSDVRLSAESLRRETGALSTALRKPQVRGRWGELHLRRSVEIAGLVEHCDFAEQVHLVDDDQVRRPDLVVRLAGGRSVVVDAKVPLDAHLDALTSDDPEEQAAHLRRHARQLRTHVDALSAKSYWRALPGTPEFVVLFVPAESFLAAALETEPDLIEYAATRDVVLASPTTLIALLRTVAHGWTTQTLAERTGEIHELGRELHGRLSVMGGHLDKLGRSLRAAVETFNQTVGSLEGRVLVTARQFEDIGVARTPLVSPRPVTEVPRPLTSPELLEASGE